MKQHAKREIVEYSLLAGLSLVTLIVAGLNLPGREGLPLAVFQTCVGVGLAGLLMGGIGVYVWVDRYRRF